MQANTSKLIVAGLLAANTARALHLGGEQTSTAPAALAQVQSESAVQAQLNVAAVSQIETQTAVASPGETPTQKRQKLNKEKVNLIFKKILDGIEEKREEALEWLCDFGDNAIGEVLDKSDTLADALQNLADNLVSDMEARQAAVNGIVDQTVADAKAEMFRLKAEAADAVTEKRKEVMYAIKDLKIEIGTTFKKSAKADKKAQIEANVSELESFINKTIRDYDEGVANQIARVSSATAAATAALETELGDATDAFDGAKAPAESDLDGVIEQKMLALDEAFEAKKEDAEEVHTYLTNNYGRYL